MNLAWPWRCATLAAGLAMLAACGDQGAPVESGTPSPGAAAPVTAVTDPALAAGVAPDVALGGPVLAWVEGSPIHAAELDYFLERRLNVPSHQAREPELRRKALESLVASRAMAYIAARDLADDDRAEIAIATAFYHEELLTRRYLEASVEPVPVSDAMVRAYYEEHLEEFGQRVLEEIEWLSTLEGLDPAQRETLLDDFQGLDARTDWAGLAEELNSGGVRIDFKRGYFAPDLLPAKLRTVVAQTAVGEVSGLHLLRGRLHRIRVVARKEQPARALAVVSDDIRKRLAPRQVRESVEKAAARVRELVTIEYPKEADG